MKVDHMTSVEEGQPSFNEPEEWQDTHTTLLTRQGPLHFHSGYRGKSHPPKLDELKLKITLSVRRAGAEACLSLSKKQALLHTLFE